MARIMPLRSGENVVKIQGVADGKQERRGHVQ